MASTDIHYEQESQLTNKNNEHAALYSVLTAIIYQATTAEADATLAGHRWAGGLANLANQHYIHSEQGV